MIRFVKFARALYPLLVQAWPILAAIAALVVDFAAGTAGQASALTLGAVGARLAGRERQLGVMAAVSGVARPLRVADEVVPAGNGYATRAGRLVDSLQQPRPMYPYGVYKLDDVAEPPPPPADVRGALAEQWPDAGAESCEETPFIIDFEPDGKGGYRNRIHAQFKYGPDGVGRWVELTSRVYQAGAMPEGREPLYMAAVRGESVDDREAEGCGLDLDAEDLGYLTDDELIHEAGTDEYPTLSAPLTIMPPRVRLDVEIGPFAPDRPASDEDATIGLPPMGGDIEFEHIRAGSPEMEAHRLAQAADPSDRASA